MGQKWSNCDPVVFRWVSETAQVLSGALGADHVGTYLHGSLASGSFFPPKSDLDLLFVSSGPLSIAARRAFSLSCVEVSRDRPIAGGLECSVVTAAAAAEPPYPTPFEVHFGEERVDAILGDELDYESDGSDADLVAHFQATREFGICLEGRPIPDVFGPVQRADFVSSVEGDLRWILEDENLLESPYYGILNACRVLWVWSRHSHRRVPTKEEAGTWAAERLPVGLRPIVLEALSVYRDEAPVKPEDLRTGGRAWDKELLLAFRDHFRALWSSDRDA